MPKLDEAASELEHPQSKHAHEKRLLKKNEWSTSVWVSRLAHSGW
jgi:hypothetical protein